MVYSAAKGLASLSLAWARKPDEGLPRPDACVFLSVAPEVAQARGGFGAERYEDVEMQERVRALFEEVRGMPEEREDMVVVDGGRSFEEVEREVQEIVRRVVVEVGRRKEEVRRVMPWPS